MVKESNIMTIKKNMKEIGKIINVMVKEFLITRMVKKSMKDIGKMEINMVKEFFIE